jgi:hypothetical protein
VYKFIVYETALDGFFPQDIFKEMGQVLRFTDNIDFMERHERVQVLSTKGPCSMGSDKNVAWRQRFLAHFQDSNHVLVPGYLGERQRIHQTGLRHGSQRK